MTQIKAPRGPDMRDSAYDVDPDFWREHSHISLQPVAAPSILGLYGFAGATFIVASNLAGWCLLVATGALTVPTGAFVALGYWLIVLAAITWAGAAAALYESVADRSAYPAGRRLDPHGHRLHARPVLGADHCRLAVRVLGEHRVVRRDGDDAPGRGGKAVLPVGKREPAGRPAPGLIQFRTGGPGVRHGQ
jgi:hypothetical protein